MTTTNSPEAQDGVRCAKCGTVRPMSTLASRDTFVCRKCFSTETEPEAQPPCCGADVRRDYEVSADSKTLRCTDCGKTYTRESVQTEAQPQSGELLPCPFITPQDRTELHRAILCISCGLPYGEHKQATPQIQVITGAPERIWLGAPYDSVNRYTTVHEHKHFDDDVLYVRADLPRATAADVERDRIIAMADALEYELPNFEQMKGVETLRKKLQAETPRATGETTVEAALAELREMFKGKGTFAPYITAGFDPDNNWLPLFIIHWVIEGVGHWTEKASTLGEAMAQVRAATHTEGSEKSLDE